MAGGFNPIYRNTIEFHQKRRMTPSSNYSAYFQAQLQVIPKKLSSLLKKNLKWLSDISVIGLKSSNIDLTSSIYQKLQARRLSVANGLTCSSFDAVFPAILQFNTFIAYLKPKMSQNRFQLKRVLTILLV